MNSYQRIISALSLNNDSQGELGWLFAILRLGAFDYEGSDTFSNPVREVLRRLELVGIGPHSLARMRSMLSSLDSKIESGGVI